MTVEPQPAAGAGGGTHPAGGGTHPAGGGTHPAGSARRIRLDRNEVSGAFGDLGTDLPLLAGMILAAGLDAASVLVTFGAMQVATGLWYRMPMPVQPLKAVAVIVIAQQVVPEVIAGGGLAIGALMLLLALSGGLDWLARIVPRAVIRGLQLGLGMQLSLLALRSYVPSDGTSGYVLAAIAAVIIVALYGNRRWPPAPFVILLGVAHALLFTIAPAEIAEGAGFAAPRARVPSWDAIVTGFLLLAIPQVPLSLGNSVLATRQLASDLFPDREPPAVRRIGITYGLMNVVGPVLGGVPTCHGSGGLAGHYALGGRTGGSVVIYGAMFLVAGFAFSGAFAELVKVFPLPMLGILLLVEGIALMRLVRDPRPRVATELPLAIGVGIVSASMPYGYAIGLVAGTVAAMLLARRR